MTEKNSMTLCIRGRYTSSSSNYLIHPMGMEEERQFYGQQTTSGVMTVSAKSREREREREREKSLRNKLTGIGGAAYLMRAGGWAVKHCSAPV